MPRHSVSGASSERKIAAPISTAVPTPTAEPAAVPSAGIFANIPVWEWAMWWNKTVDRFAGDPLAGGLTHLELRDTVTGEKSDFAVDGAFVAIGHAPSTELFKGKLPVDDGGYLIVEPGTPKTAIPGVFACGDVMDHTYRQAVTAAGTGCMAALDAERFVSGLSVDLKGHAEAAETV